MFNKLMAISASSPPLLESFIAFNQYAFFIPLSFVTMNTLLGPKNFNHSYKIQWPNLVNPNTEFIIYFSKDYNKALSTHSVIVPC
jgi:hypothetical protein